MEKSEFHVLFNVECCFFTPMFVIVTVDTWKWNTQNNNIICRYFLRFLKTYMTPFLSGRRVSLCFRIHQLHLYYRLWPFPTYNLFGWLVFWYLIVGYLMPNPVFIHILNVWFLNSFFRYTQLMAKHFHF